MAIKLSGETIIDDSRVIVNADKIGIGQTTPRFDLEIRTNLSETTDPTGIAVSTTSTQLESDTENKAISVFNNTDDTTFSVNYRGRVDALEYHGIFKGSIDSGVAAEKANKVKVQTNNDDDAQYLTFVNATSDYKDLRVHTGIKYNPNFYGDNSYSRLSIDGNVSIAGTLTYEDVTNVDSLGIVTARKGFRATEGGLHIKAGVSTFQGDVKITQGELDVPTGIVTAGKGLRVSAGGFTVTGVSTLGGHLIPDSNETYNIGQDPGTVGNKRWNAIYAKEFRGGTFYGTIDGNVNLVADTVKTVTRSTNATHYLTFVDSNNDPDATAESMYTDADINYNPSTNQLVVSKIKPAKILDKDGGSGSEDNVIKVDSSGDLVWGDVDAGSIGTLNFTDLDDTPANYTNQAEKLVRVNTAGNALEFVDASSPGKTYDLTVEQSGNPASDADPILRLSDGTPSNNDDITITGGTGIDVNRKSGTELEISSSGVADLKLVQHSNHTPSPKPERTCSNPIQVAIANGVATIGIGSTSNAYGTRFVSDTAPSGIDLCEGDIWYDLTGSGSSASIGSTKIAVLRDEKSAGTYGGKAGSGDYTGKRAYYMAGASPEYDSDAWFPRVLNTKYDPNNIVTSFGNGVESGNQYSNTFSLAQGKYKISWRAPGVHCDRFQTRLAYNTNSDFSGTTSYYYGSSQYSGGDPTTPPGGDYSDSVDESEGEYIADISETTYFRIEQWIYTNKVYSSGVNFTDATLGTAINRVSNTNALISPAASPTEVYTQVKIEDLATATKDVDVVVNAGTSKIAVLRDRKNNNVNAGHTDKVSGTPPVATASWNDRDLTVKDDPFNFVTFYPTINGETTVSRGKTPGYFSLPAGTYKIKFKTGAIRVGRHTAALVWSKNSGDISSAYNAISNPASSFDGGYVYGTSPSAFGNVESTNVASGNATYNTSYSTGSTIVTISETHFFKVIHYNEVWPGYSWAWGLAVNTGSSVDESNYTTVEIEDLKSAVLEAGSGGSSFVLLPEKTSTSGTEVEFTGIPSDAYEITVMFNGVSVNRNIVDILIQLGNSSAYITSGYDSSSEQATGSDQKHSTSGFIIKGGDTSFSYQGQMVINKASSSSYTEIGQFKRSNDAACECFGSLSSVSGTIDRLKVTLARGSNTFSSGDEFDAGTISVSYKTSGTVSGGSGSGGSYGDSDVDAHLNTSTANTGEVLSWTGTDYDWVTQSSGGSGSVTTSMQVFTTAGSHTYTPTSGTTSIIVHVIGGGGGSGSAKHYGFSGGAGAGGVGIRHYNSTEIGTSAAITVGAGGAGGASGTSPANNGDGSDGLASSFDPGGTGVTLTATGGTHSDGAGHQVRTAGGAGGVANSNTEIYLNGEAGYKNMPSSDGSNNVSVDGHYDNNRGQIYAKAGYGGYGTYGRGGRGTIAGGNTQNYIAGEAGDTGAVIIYEYGGSGGSGSGGGSLIKLGTVTTTSGTAAPFTNIPSTAKKITVSVHRFSYSGDSDDDLIMEVGDSSGYIQTGYQSNYDNRDNSPNAQSSTSYYGLADGTSSFRQYNINIELVNTSGNNWSISHTGGGDGTGGAEQISYGGGSVSLSNALNRLRIRTVNDRTFDNGEISVYYETEEGTATVNKIQQGNTSAEVIDTGSDGHFIVKAEGKEKFSVNGSTNNIFIGAHTSDNPFTYLRFAASQYGAADIRPVDELNHKIGLSFYTDNTPETNPPSASNINPNERLRITHNGVFNFGGALVNDPVTTSGNVLAGIKLLGSTGSTTPYNGYPLAVNSQTITGIFNRTESTGRILEFKYNASVKGSIETDGTNTSYNTSSDYRLKENIVGISDGITRLKTLNPYRFNFKSHPEKTVDGFLAHEVTTAVPEAIIGTKDQVDSDNNPVYQQIDQSKLVPLLVAALQEAVAKIEILETEVAALKG